MNKAISMTLSLTMGVFKFIKATKDAAKIAKAGT
jgi:hypothetical protein